MFLQIAFLLISNIFLKMYLIMMQGIELLYIPGIRIYPHQIRIIMNTAASIINEDGSPLAIIDGARYVYLNEMGE
jgi:hypothetical protein